MPAFFINWLRSLPDDQAAEVWTYFDSTPTSSEDVVVAIAESHPEVCARLCAPDPVEIAR